MVRLESHVCSCNCSSAPRRTKQSRHLEVGIIRMHDAVRITRRHRGGWNHMHSHVVHARLNMHVSMMFMCTYQTHTSIFANMHMRILCSSLPSRTTSRCVWRMIMLSNHVIAVQCLSKTADCIAQVLGIPNNRVATVNKRLGGGFGGKYHRNLGFSSAAAVRVPLQTLSC